MKTKENGVTLVVLVITIILILILASVGVTVGTSTLDTAAFTQFKSELKVMQNKVNELNQENKTDIGQKLTNEQKSILNITAISDIIFNGKTDEEKTKIQDGFRYFSKDYINTELNLDSVKRNYLVNVEYRYVIFPDGFEYEDVTYYIIDQIEDEIYNVRYNDKNEKSGSFEVNTTKEDNKWKVEISNIQYNGYVSKWQVKYKLEGATYWETSNDLTFYVREEGVYTIKVVHGDEIDLGEQRISTCEFNLAKNVNEPQISEGMIPVKHNGTNWVICSKDDNDWYSYTSEDRLWANVMLCDGKYDTTTAVGTVVADSDLGSMFVWIPRYAYQIETNCNNGGTDISGKINIKFLQGTTNNDSTGKEISTTYPAVVDNKMQDFVVHPAFETDLENGGWDKDLPGIWVAKYAAGFQECTQTISSTGTVTEPTTNTSNVKYSDKYYTSYDSRYTTNALSQDLSSTNYASQKISYPVFKPLTYAYNLISTGDSFTISREIAKASSFYGLNSNKTDSHQMKNSEWGAVAYLTQSNYGRDKTEVIINSKNLGNLNSKFIYAVTGYEGSNTANGVGASSTNNMSGVFDLSGCVWELTAGYIENPNGESNRNAHGGELVAETNLKYKTIYSYTTSDTRTDNYNEFKKLSTTRFGDGILETSATGEGSTSWHGDYSCFPYSGSSFFKCCGYYGLSSAAGAFAFLDTSGVPRNYYGFRAVLVVV